MPALEEAIETAVRAAYLGWTGGEGRSVRAPIESFLGPRPAEAEQAPRAVRPRPAHIVRWSEIVACMEAATDISAQVEAEIDRTTPHPELVAQPMLRPMTASRPSAA